LVIHLFAITLYRFLVSRMSDITSKVLHNRHICNWYKIQFISNMYGCLWPTYIWNRIICPARILTTLNEMLEHVNLLVQQHHELSFVLLLVAHRSLLTLYRVFLLLVRYQRSIMRFVSNSSSGDPPTFIVGRLLKLSLCNNDLTLFFIKNISLNPLTADCRGWKDSNYWYYLGEEWESLFMWQKQMSFSGTLP
jgi:hypothetical protein